MLPQTELSLGDCSYLNTCHHLDVCRYKHYRPASPTEEAAKSMANLRANQSTFKTLPESEFLPAQWLDCDLRKLDLTVLGKFNVIMADPPWDSGFKLSEVNLTKRLTVACGNHALVGSPVGLVQT